MTRHGYKDESGFVLPEDSANEQRPAEQLPDQQIQTDKDATSAGSRKIVDDSFSRQKITADYAASVMASFNPGKDSARQDGETPCHSTNATNSDLFQTATPSSASYRYYQSRTEVSGFKASGNSIFQGMDCEFYQFSAIQTAWQDDPLRRLKIPALRRILKQDAAPDELAAKAKEMACVFRVDSHAFNPRDDKEQEIANLYLRNSCILSGLRSFAWTLAAYCQKNETTPAEIPRDTLEKLVDFIARRNWLNYEAGSYCSGLCTGSDLQVF